MNVYHKIMITRHQAVLLSEMIKKCDLVVDRIHYMKDTIEITSKNKVDLQKLREICK